MRRSIAIAALLALAAFGNAESFLTFPDIRGNQVAFTAEGDVWLYDIGSGEAHRVTSDSGLEFEAHFSPDGTHLAYAANYDGGQELYVMPLSGGVPKRVTYDYIGADLMCWTPDGKGLVFRSSSKMYALGAESSFMHELFTVPLAGGMPTKIAVPRGSFASISADGRLAYVPGTNEWMNWFRYQAGQADSIWLTDMSGKSFEKLTNTNSVDTQPVWCGKTIYFVSERTGIRNLWSLDPKTKATKQITFSTKDPVRYPSSDGKRVIFQLGPKLAVYDPAKSATQVLDIKLQSDHIHARPFQFPVAGGVPSDISPTGKRIAMVSRGHLVTLPVGEGAMHPIIDDSNQRVQGGAWSPDGKSLAYVTDLSGEEQIWLADPNGVTAPKQLTKDLKGEHSTPIWSPDSKYLLVGDRESNVTLVDATTGATKTVSHSDNWGSYDSLMSDFAFSPDSKWVAYAENGARGISRAFLYNIADGKATPITEPTIDSGSVAFSPDGLYLYMLQARNPSMVREPLAAGVFLQLDVKLTVVLLSKSTPSPFLAKNDEEGAPAPKTDPADPKKMKVDLENISDRVVDMKLAAGGFRKVVPAGNRILLVGAQGLAAYDPASKALTVLSPGVRGIDLSADGKKLLVAGVAGYQVVDSGTGPFPPSQGLVKTAGNTITIDPAAEWKQIFYESWRVCRDFFYDPNMHGVNWAEVKAKYEVQLPQVGDRGDLTRLLSNMVSELNTGHCYVAAPSPFNNRPPRTGSLGVDLEFDKAAGAYRIAHILHGGKWSLSRTPLDEPGAKAQEGEYLLKIGGVALRPDQNPEALLAGTEGQNITVTVGPKPTLEGSRTLVVVPLDTDIGFRSREFIESRRAYVSKASGGQVGYVYVPDMQEEGWLEFARSYYPQVDMAGLIIDVRGNGGGFVSGNLLSRLNTKITGYFAFRSGANYRREGWAPSGRVAAVTNEWAFSDGEYFSEYFKRLKIGPLVGHRTGGGEVGSGGGYGLVDGGSIYVPNYGAWTGKEWVIEGRGAVPDYEVDQDQAAVMAGRDPQLDKAIQLLMDDLKKHPYVKPAHPPFPVKTGGSRGGS